MAEDPLLAPLPKSLTGQDVQPSAGADIALSLLKQTNLSADRIANIIETKIDRKSLLLLPTPTGENKDSRAIRLAKIKQQRDSKRKPRPLSAAERRRSGYNDIPKEAWNYSLYVDLNKLWTGYISEVLKGGGYEAKLLKADYHGASLTVIKCKCPSRLFLFGIVVKETRHTFVICTKNNVLKNIPKEGTVFQFEAELIADTSASPTTTENAAKPDVMKWEVCGEHFGYRAAERVGKKFKGRHTIDF